MKITPLTTALLALLGAFTACTSHDEAIPSSPTEGVEGAVLTLRASLPTVASTRTNSEGDSTVTRCYVQAFTADGTDLKMVDAPQPMTDVSTTGTQFDAQLFLDANLAYTFLFWADSAPEGRAAPTDLRAVDYVENTIAYAGRQDIAASASDAAAWTAGISLTLQHVVAKLTLNTTHALPANRAVSLTLPANSTYTQYNALSGSTVETSQNANAYTTSTVNTAVAANATVLTCYALVSENTPTLTIHHDGLTQEVPNVPLAPNRHTTLSGNVPSVGYKDYTFTVTATTSWGENLEVGDGYTYDPVTKTYTVSNANGLLAWNAAALNDLTTNCTLTEDIDLTGKDWTPVIGRNLETYSGTFDGAGHTVSGLVTKGVRANDTAIAGFFGGIDVGGTVKDLHVEGTITENTGIRDMAYVGGIAGTCQGTISGCSFSGQISSSSMAGFMFYGGIAGIIDGNSKLIACHSSGTILSSTNGVCGGFFGMVYGGNEVQVACYSTMNVQGGFLVGGLVGVSDGSITFSACYWSSNIEKAVGNGTIKGEATRITDGDWTAAMSAMNTALTDNGYSYQWQENTDSLTKDAMPLILKR